MSADEIIAALMRDRGWKLYTPALNPTRTHYRYALAGATLEMIPVTPCQHQSHDTIAQAAACVLGPSFATEGART